MKEIAATTKHFPPHRTLIWNLESLDVGEWHMIAGLSFAAQVITDGVVALEGTNELSFDGVSLADHLGAPLKFGRGSPIEIFPGSPLMIRPRLISGAKATVLLFVRNTHGQ